MDHAATVLARLVGVVEEQGFSAHALHVLVGERSALHRWSVDVPRDVHSVAKGVCVVAVGMACDEGVFDIDAPVAEYLPELVMGAAVEGVTTRHLLAMTSGIDLPWSETMFTDWPDLAAEFLSRPSRGRVFQYAGASTYTAMRALAAVVGDVAAFLQPRLFAPLDIEQPSWERCPLGHIRAADGLSLQSADLAKFGRVLRDRGRWSETQLVSPGWVDAMHSEWTVRAADPGYTHYALSGWGGPGAAWRLHGAYGQMLIFVGDAVVTVTADDHFGADRVAQVVVSALSA